MRSGRCAAHLDAVHSVHERLGRLLHFFSLTAHWHLVYTADARNEAKQL